MEVYRCRKCRQNLEVQNSVIRNFACQHGNLKWPEQSVQSTNQNHPNSDPTNQNSDNYQPQTTDGFTPYGMAHNGSHWGQHTSQYQTTQCFHPYLNLRDSQTSAVSAESAKRSSLASTSSFSQDAGGEERDDQVDTAGTHEAAPSIFDIQPTQQKIIAPKLRKRTFSETSTGSERDRHPSGNRGQQHKADDNKDSLSQPKQKQAGGGVGGLFSHKKEMKLPDDKEPSIVWDPVKKRWVDKDGAGEEEKPAAPPPTDHELKGQHGNLKWPEQSVQSTNQNHPNSDPTNQNSDNYQPQTTDGFTPYGMAHNGSHWGQHTSQYQTTQCFHPYLNLRDSQTSALSAESAKRSSLASTSSFSQDAGWEERDGQVDTAGTHEAAPSIFDIQPTQQKIIVPKLRKRTFSETSTGSERDRHPSGNRGQQHKAGDNKDSLSQPKQKQAGGGVGGLLSHKKEMKLPDDKEPSIVWDPVKKRWVDKDGAEEEEKPAAPPPTDHELKGMAHNGSHWGQHTSQYQTTQCFHPYLNLRDSQTSAVSAESAKRSCLASTSSFSQDADGEERDDQVDTAGTHEAAPSIFDIQPTQQKIIAPKLRKRTFSGTSTGSERDRHPSGNRGQQHKADDNKDSLSQQKQKQAGGGVGGLFSHKKEMKLPDDKEPSIVWDPVKKRWVDTDGAGEEEKPAAPPPTDHELKGCNDVNSSQSSVVYLDVDLCPEWIVQSFEQASWIKGKLLCIKCKGRLGSFDFVNQKVCGCQQHTIPVVHLLTNRIDQVQKRQNISPVFPLVQYRDVQMRSTANGCSNPDDSVSATVVSANNNEESNTKSDHESDERDKIINIVETEHTETNSIFLQDEYTPQNCCGQVDLFTDHGEAFGEEFRSVNDNLSETNVSDYNVFDVLSVIEDEPDDVRGEKQTMEGQDTHKEIQDIPTELTCAVCLEIFYRPHRCDPCNHIFCEHCLRQVCKQTPTLTPCPLCREVIRKCVFQNDLTEVISTEHEQLYKERHHDVRKKRKDKYPLPGCTASQHMRYLRERRQHGGATQWTYREEQNFIIRGCLQEILVRLAWLLLIFLVHNILFRLDNWLMWDVYTPISDNFNSFLLTLTCKLLLFGIIYCVKKCFCINMESQFMGQAVLFVFIFSVLWDSNSWIQFMLNMVVLGSLFL